MATHSSILAWRIPWVEEPGRLQQSMGSQRVRHNCETTFHFSPLLSEINICPSGEAESLISEIICPDITGLLRGATGIKTEFCMIRSSCVSYYTFKVYALSPLSLPGIKLIKDSRQQSKSLIPTIDKCLHLATLAWSQLIPKKICDCLTQKLHLQPSSRSVILPLCY